MSAPDVLFSVVGMLVDERGYVLAISRKDDHDDFGLPGGKIEPGERPFEALCRELYEELGILVCKVRLVCFESPDNVPSREPKLCRTYFVTEWRNETRSVEGQCVEWVPFRSLVRPTSTFRFYNEALWSFLLTEDLGRRPLWAPVPQRTQRVTP